MPSSNFNLETRINALKSVLSEEADQGKVEEALNSANGDWKAAEASLKEKKLSSATLKKLNLAHALAEWSEDNAPIVKALVGQRDIKNLRDVALHYNVDKLSKIIDAEVIPERIAGKGKDEKKKGLALALQHKLFAVETSAVLQRMTQDEEIPIVDENLRSGVVQFFDNQPNFNIRNTSVYTALKHPEAFKNIPEEQRPKIVEEVKTLQRVQAISPIQEAVPVLMNANLTSAFQVAEIPESTFLKAYSTTLGEETARQVYTNAINNRIRSEQALMTMREAVRGTGLAIIDGTESIETRMANLRAAAARQEVPLLPNLEELFGDMDYCECEECTSVYSPASYFVELLQYLRNNNLGPDPSSGDPDPANNPNIHPGIENTPLEKLFRRRPDLGCLELTCDNTFTVLPYIDLVNEVMESFVVHLEEYKNSSDDPNQRQARLETFNIEDEITSELLAQPQHTNYQAYCILKSAVYPFTLPYHQPIDSTRISLKYLGTSRYELLDVYRGSDENCTHPSLSPERRDELKKLHKETVDRAVDAEFLGMTQEEYIILTKEAFWPKRYFDITLKKTHTEKEYQHNIGVKPVYEYYGYTKEKPEDTPEDDMLSTDETKKLGLTFVKKQFLPRTFTLITKEETRNISINTRGYIDISDDQLMLWQQTPDTCNLDKVRLTHLNGEKLTEDEYDRIHRFLRLWRKLGWTIDEIDEVPRSNRRTEFGKSIGSLSA
jgi:hypothetical protein